MKKQKGRGLLNVVSSAINKGIDLLPAEFHLKNYNYCGPGTKLKTRLARGDRGINKLDEACKEHDIAYSKYSDNQRRKQADQLLADRAWARVKSPDASVAERAAAWVVTTAMNAKSKLGGKLKGRGYYLRPYRGSGKIKKKN